MITREIIAASIDSRLDALADAATVRLIERDSASPLTPTAQAWRTLTEGNTVQLRFGLAGVGLSDYGTFRVDDTSYEPRADGGVSVIRARDRAALLLDEGTSADYGWGDWPKDAPAAYTNPSARSLAERIAGLVGLGVVWEAPNYTLEQFSLSPDESAGAALERLLAPLRLSRRYRADAWVAGNTLIVRRRGSDAVAGTLDVSKGTVRELRRQRQPAWGDILVYGAIHQTGADFGYTSRQIISGGGTSIATSQDIPGHRVVETGIVDTSGRRVIVSRETEDLLYRTVYYSPGANGGAGAQRVSMTSGGLSGSQGDERVLGEVLVRSSITEDRDLHTDEVRHLRRVTEFSYDADFRLVLQEERESEYTSGAWAEKRRTITRYEQVTPTELRTVVTTISVSGDEEKVKSTTYQQGPGTLQSGIRQLAQETGEPYSGTAHGGGARRRVERDENLVGDAICQQIADDLAAESGQYLYSLSLSWPRPFPYRKGQRVTLTNLPGGLGSIDATIVSLATSFDVEQALWMHTVGFEAWSAT